MGVMCDKHVTERDRSSQKRQLIIKLRTVNIRVVHSWHFWSIFQSFFNHFPFHFVSIFLKIETENESKMKVKWNPNLAFAKMDPKNDHFSSFWQCA